MNRLSAFGLILKLDMAITTLQGQWNRPYNETETNVLASLRETQDEMRSEYKLLEHLEQQRQDIFARMTPDLVVSTLEVITSGIRDEIRDEKQLGMSAAHFEIDIIHLRQIADWLEMRTQETRQ
jgi:membrane carboxypeptidase/penicillin-binding protein PbpC